MLIVITIITIVMYKNNSKSDIKVGVCSMFYSPVVHTISTEHRQDC